MKRGSVLLFSLGLMLMSFGQILDSLKKELSQASATERPKVLIALCDASMNQDNSQALQYAEEAITASEQVSDTSSLAKSCLMAGELLNAFDRPIESRSNLERALSLATLIENRTLIADAHGALGSLFSSLLDHEKSLFHFRIGIDMARQDSNVMLLVKSMNNMAFLFEVQGEYHLALKSFLECTEVLEGTKWDGTRIYYITIMNSGMVSNSMGDHRSAVNYLRRALSGFRNLDLRPLEAQALVGLVHSFTQLGQLDSALAYHELTLPLYSNSDFSTVRHFRDQTYAELLFEMKKYPEVIVQELTKLEEIQEDTAYWHYAANASDLLYKTFKILKDNRNALKYLELYNEFNGYVQSQRAADEVKSLRIRFETELDFEAKEREVLELQLKDDLKEKEIDRQKAWRNFILALAILGLIISVLILNGLKLQKRASEAESSRLEVDNSKLKMEVEHKNRELSSTAMFVAQKNQMLMTLQDQLSKISSPDSGMSQKELRNIRNQIRENINLEEDWERIKLHFEEVYPEFFSNLKSEHPQLTSLELKHCAYMRMGLSIKEVARMLSVAPKSVQMSHYRLKKKLGLGQDDNLSAHLGQY